MTSITSAAKAKMIADGWQVLFTASGPVGSGKTRHATAFANKQKAAGKKVLIEDLEDDDGLSFTAVWVKS